MNNAKCDRVGGAQRRQRNANLRRKAQRLLRRDEDSKPGRAGDETSDDRRRVRDELLEVVEHERSLAARSQRVNHGLCGVASHVDPERCGDPRKGFVGGTRRGQLAESERGWGTRAARVGCEVEGRERRLADAGRAHQRDDPRSRSERLVEERAIAIAANDDRTRRVHRRG
jgi:hypothetical protein